MTLLLTPQLEQFVQSQIESGKYTSMNEVIVAALKLLEEREHVERLETVKEIEQGLADVKEGRTVSIEEFEARMRQKYGISS